MENKNVLEMSRNDLLPVKDTDRSWAKTNQGKATAGNQFCTIPMLNPGRI